MPLLISPDYGEQIDYDEIYQQIDWERETKGTLGRFTIIIFPDGRALVRSKIRVTRSWVDTSRNKLEEKKLKSYSIRWHKFYPSTEDALDDMIERYLK